MKKHTLYKPVRIERQPDTWPDMYEQNNKFFQPDNDRFTVMAILITIILILVMVICCQCTKMYEISNRDVEATAPSFDDSQALKVETLKFEITITMPVYPDTPDVWMPDLPTGKFKTYMDYRTITRRDSAQYQLQQLAWTDADGFRRYEQYYLIALGTGFGNTIGQTYEITLSGGRVFLGMLGDVKADEHTDPTHRFIQINGNIVEFIIDNKKMDADVLTGGDVSPLGFDGAVQKIRKVEFK